MNSFTASQLCVKLLTDKFSVPLTSAVLGRDGVSVKPISTALARRPPVTRPAAQTLPRYWITAARQGQVQIAVAGAGLAQVTWYSGRPVVSVGTSRRQQRDGVKRK